MNLNIKPSRFELWNECIGKIYYYNTTPYLIKRFIKVGKKLDFVVFDGKEELRLNCQSWFPYMRPATPKEAERFKIAYL
jgi:hypothetical protein